MPFLFLSLLLVFVNPINCGKYFSCQYPQFTETRDLYIATCDTEKKIQATKIWNITSWNLRDQGVYMINVCRGKKWNGFLTKPLTYFDFLSKLPRTSSRGGTVHAILTDSDTLWSTKSIDTIWNKYDCARGNKSIVMSTEMSCWVGRYCTTEDMHRWLVFIDLQSYLLLLFSNVFRHYYLRYNNTPMTPSYSPFANSGVVMGEITKLQSMLDYIIKNNQSYFITYGKHKFDDQYAMADYAIKVAPNDVALDYHQQLCASFTVGETKGLNTV